jgi:hypothetical protein
MSSLSPEQIAKLVEFPGIGSMGKYVPLYATGVC